MLKKSSLIKFIAVYVVTILCGLGAVEAQIFLQHQEVIQLDDSLAKALKVKRLHLLEDYYDIEDGDTYSYYEYDTNGFLSLMADTHPLFSEKHYMTNILDEEGRLIREVETDIKTSLNNVEDYSYDKQGRLLKQTQEILAYKHFVIETQYKYEANRLMEETNYIADRQTQRKVYIYSKNDLPDSARLEIKDGRKTYTMNRYFYSYSESGTRLRETEVFITGDTLTDVIFNAEGDTVFHLRQTRDSKPRRGVFIPESTAYFYKKGRRVKAIYKNETFRSKDGGEWSQEWKYDKKGKPIREFPDSIKISSFEFMDGDWKVMGQTMNGDTSKFKKERVLDNGDRESWTKTIDFMRFFLGGLSQKGLGETWKYELRNESNKAVKAYQLTKNLEERCVTDTKYYSKNQMLSQFTLCEKSSFKKGDDSKEDYFFEYDEQGRLTRRGIRTRNFDAKDTLKLLTESIFMYKNNLVDSSITVTYIDRRVDTTGYKFKYDELGRKLQITPWSYRKKKISASNLSSYTYYGNSKTTKQQKVYSSRDDFNNDQPYRISEYDEQGKLLMVTTYDQYSHELYSTIQYLYNDKGLCVAEKIESKRGGIKTKNLSWEYY